MASQLWNAGQMIFTILNSTASIKLVWWGDFKRNFCICTDKIQSKPYVGSWSVPVPQWGSTSQRRSGTQTPPSSSAAPASVSTSSASSPLTSASTLPSSGLRWSVIGGYSTHNTRLWLVQDGAWGGIMNGSWNGLVAELINHETDLVMTSLKINSAR